MKPTEFRDTLRNRIMAVFEPDPGILAAWEGGSAATGYLDDYSDLDLGIVVRNDYVEESFKLFEDLLEADYGIKHRLRIPEPAWHGHSQCFYFLKTSPPLFYVDFLVEKESAENRLIEPDRHGISLVWLNRSGILSPLATPVDTMKEKCRLFFRRQMENYPIFDTQVRKQILRGRKIDAMLEYQIFIQRVLAGFLNLKYRPAKYDFGIRYGDRDYPAEVAERVCRLFYPGSPGDLESGFEEASAWAQELMEDLKKVMVE